MTWHFLQLLESLLVFVAPAVFLIWAIQRWWRTSPRIGTSAWRGYLAVGAISFAASSELLWIVSGFRANTVGGFHVDDHLLIWLIRFGFFLGPAGLLTSFFGKGLLRWPACGLSAFMTFLWIATGISV